MMDIKISFDNTFDYNNQCAAIAETEINGEKYRFMYPDIPVDIDRTNPEGQRMFFEDMVYQLAKDKEYRTGRKWTEEERKLFLSKLENGDFNHLLKDQWGTWGQWGTPVYESEEKCFFNTNSKILILDKDDHEQIMIDDKNDMKALIKILIDNI